ncbi:MAG: zf-TFIIB domain-containing protein [Elusimicrobia bacterium]|jgi:Zn-finger nucleic acid-binding protein|nr:zf-TFIIB domain-containing protein [Elusimicrobiota bacterium]
MNCPACRSELTEMTVSGLKVDVCKAGCHGVWLDNYEIEKVDEAHESAGEQLLDFTHNPQNNVDPSASRKCPQCQDVVMQRFFFSVRKEVEIDDCPKCGGTWLDANELSAIRSSYKTKEDRENAGKALFSKMFDKDLSEQAARSQADLERSERFARAVKYVLPSYWIPGKQKGGAF